MPTNAWSNWLVCAENTVWCAEPSDGSPVLIVDVRTDDTSATSSDMHVRMMPYFHCTSRSSYGC